MSEIVRSMAMLTLVLVVACGDDAAATPDGAGPGGSRIVLSDFRFDPDGLSVTAGDEVNLELANGGGHRPHLGRSWRPRGRRLLRRMWPRTDLLFEATVDPGGSVVVAFDAPAAQGTYAVVCTIPGHVEAGMIGELIVTG